MTILLQGATVIDPASKHHKKEVDIVIRNGSIEKIAESIDTKANKTIDTKGSYISPGWMDMYANFHTPGNEHRETLTTGAKAASAGGYTAVCLSPHTLPLISHKSVIQSILKQESKNLPINIYVGGSFYFDDSKQDYAEIFDLHNNGVTYLSNGELYPNDKELFLKILLYAKNFDIPIFYNLYPEEMMKGIVALESKHTYSLGLKTRPRFWEHSIADELCQMIDYSMLKGIIHGATQEKTIKTIKKSKHPNIKTSVSASSLYFSEHHLDEHYDSNYKMLPPLSRKKDITSLKKHFMNNNIHFITSHHNPKVYDEKVTDIESAAFGNSTIQYTYSMINTAFDILEPEKWVNTVAINNRKFLNIDIPSILEGQKANFTVFNPNTIYNVDEEKHFSKSKNFPLFNQKLKGKVIATYYNNQLYLHQN